MSPLALRSDIDGDGKSKRCGQNGQGEAEGGGDGMREEARKGAG